MLGLAEIQFLATEPDFVDLKNLTWRGRKKGSQIICLHKTRITTAFP